MYADDFFKKVSKKNFYCRKKIFAFVKKTLDICLKIVYYIQALCVDLTSKQNGPLAQWSELSAHNRLVRGSNP